MFSFHVKYLELRFKSRVVRLIATITFTAQIIVYMGKLKPRKMLHKCVVEVKAELLQVSF